VDHDADGHNHDNERRNRNSPQRDTMPRFTDRQARHVQKRSLGLCFRRCRLARLLPVIIPVAEPDDAEQQGNRAPSQAQPDIGIAPADTGYQIIGQWRHDNLSHHAPGQSEAQCKPPSLFEDTVDRGRPRRRFGRKRRNRIDDPDCEPLHVRPGQRAQPGNGQSHQDKSGQDHSPCADLVYQDTE